MTKNKEATETVVKKKKDAPKKGGRQAGTPKKPSLFARLKGYLVGVFAEMKRVVWPSRKEVLNSTLIVIVTLIFFGIFMFVIDWLATGGMDILIGIAAG